MADKITKEQRSKTMRAIRSTGTTMEKKVTSELWKRGFRFRKNVKTLMGSPDIAIQKYKVVIFLDSCFFHVCPIHGRIPRSNVEYWEKKLKRNVERDNMVNEFFLQKGWNVMRIWEHEVKKEFETTIEKIAAFIEKAKLPR